MRIENWNIQERTGYEPQTTFYTDFSIAEIYGTAAGGESVFSAVKDTYKRAFNEWKNDIVYITELVMVLNWKIWRWYKENEKLARLYNDLWMEARDWCYENLEGDDLNYFIRVTD